MPSLFREHPNSIPRFSPARFPPRSAASSRIAPVPSTLLGGVSIQKTTVEPQAETWGSLSVLRFEVRRPQAGFGEGLHRTRHFHLAVLNRRSASLWPTTNRWFFGKASTRSSIHDTTRYHFTSTTGCFTARAINSPCHQEALPPYPKK